MSRDELFEFVRDRRLEVATPFAHRWELRGVEWTCQSGRSTPKSASWYSYQTKRVTCSQPRAPASSPCAQTLRVNPPRVSIADRKQSISTALASSRDPPSSPMKRTDVSGSMKRSRRVVRTTALIHKGKPQERYEGGRGITRRTKITEHPLPPPAILRASAPQYSQLPRL